MERARNPSFKLDKNGFSLDSTPVCSSKLTPVLYLFIIYWVTNMISMKSIHWTSSNGIMTLVIIRKLHIFSCFEEMPYSMVFLERAVPLVGYFFREHSKLSNSTLGCVLGLSVTLNAIFRLTVSKYYNVSNHVYAPDGWSTFWILDS